jgi:hypothetical protein
LQRLTALRRELETALIRAARSLAQKAGVDVSATMEREVQETLSAALARPEVADEVRTGRLVKPAAYAGFGTFLPVVSPAGAQKQHETEKAETRPAARSREPDMDELEVRAAQRARERREEAERHVQQARAVLEVAAGAVADQRRAAEVTHQQHQAVRKRVEQLQEQLRDLKEEVAAAERAAVAAAADRDQAEKAHDTARRTLEQAEQAEQAEQQLKQSIP